MKNVIEEIEDMIKTLPTKEDVIRKEEKLDYLPCYDKECLEEILNMYLLGASINDISEFMKLSDREVNQILDHYSQYL